MNGSKAQVGGIVLRDDWREPGSLFAWIKAELAAGRPVLVRKAK